MQLVPSSDWGPCPPAKPEDNEPMAPPGPEPSAIKDDQNMDVGRRTSPNGNDLQRATIRGVGVGGSMEKTG